MQRAGRWLTAAIAVFILIILTAAAYGIPPTVLSALPEPSSVETFLANSVKDWFIYRGGGSVPAGPPPTTAEVEAGKSLYGMACAYCHGHDGHTLPPVAHFMYPRVLDLGSRAVQKHSDKELFWIIQHGIRMTAMPGFGRLLSNDEIWQLTDYVRSLGRSVR